MKKYLFLTRILTVVFLLCFFKSLAFGQDVYISEPEEGSTSQGGVDRPLLKKKPSDQMTLDQDQPNAAGGLGDQPDGILTDDLGPLKAPAGKEASDIAAKMKAAGVQRPETAKLPTKAKEIIKPPAVVDAKKKTPEAPSAIESVFFGKFPGVISREMKQFGYDLFSQQIDQFSPIENVPVGPDYIVGPGDSFTVNVWGNSNFSYPVTVRRDGTIFIPKIGTVQVWGDSFKNVSAKIEKKLANYFSGIKVSIAFDTIRAIDVFVVGEVKRPGVYSIPSTSVTINALFSAGGPTKSGSLRNIQIIRNNQKIATIDLYDFLIAGINGSQKLQSQDTILVPVIGKVAAIAGNVKRPGIYEVKDQTSLFDTVEMGGGLTFTGQIGRLSLERVQDNKKRITRDFMIPENFKSLTLKEVQKTDLATPVEDGDLVKIFPVLPTLRQTVFLRGHVKRPGSYEFKEGMSVRALIHSYDELLPEPYTQYVQIVRTSPPTDQKQSLFANLQKILDGDTASDIALQERDEVVVFSKEELNLKDKVSIEGKVNKPGEYYYFDGMKLRDLIFMAGNLPKDAYLANAEIGRYTIIDNKLKFERLQVNLNEVLAENPTNNQELKPRDRIFIKGVSDWELNNVVFVSGEVRYPGFYSFVQGERLSSILERAGGYSPKAFLPGSVFTRDSVKLIQEKSLKEQISNLEQAILQETLNPGKQLGSDDLKNQQEAIIARKAMLANLQNARASGRMIIRLDAIKDFKGSASDVQLEPGDALSIPPTPSAVTVMGEVFNPSSMVYIPGKTVSYYLDKAGNMTQNADADSIFIIKADGSVISRRQNRGFLLRSFYQNEIERGDAILVPKDITRFSWLNTTKDLTDILFKIASTTGITLTALK